MLFETSAGTLPQAQVLTILPPSLQVRVFTPCSFVVVNSSGRHPQAVSWQSTWVLRRYQPLFYQTRPRTSPLN